MAQKKTVLFKKKQFLSCFIFQVESDSVRKYSYNK